MSTNNSGLLPKGSEKSVPASVNQIALERLRDNGGRGLTTIDKALDETSNTSLVKVLLLGQRQHVVLPVIAAFVHFLFLLLIRQPDISAVFFTLLLTSLASSVWTTLKAADHRLDKMDEKMDVIQRSLESIKLTVSRRPTVDYVPIVHPVFSDKMDEAPPQPETSELNVRPPNKLGKATQPVKQDEAPVDVKEQDSMTLHTLETARNDESPVILKQINPISASLGFKVDYPPADKPDSIQAPLRPDVRPPALMAKPDHIPTTAESDRQGDNKSTTSNPPPLPPFGLWSSVLFEIKQRIEPLALDTLQRLPQSSQKEPFAPVNIRRIATRLLMYCASFSTADFASPNGFFGPLASVPYYPTGDLERDRNIAFTAALDCLDELTALLTSNAKAEVAATLAELAQALNDLGLHEYASSVSSFALEVLRGLYTAEPDRFRSRIVSVQSLRANIFVDLRRHDDAADAAEEAVAILRATGETQPELVYAMLNYAVLLGSIGRGDGAVAVSFELVGLIDDSANLRSEISVISPFCRLCCSNACIEVERDLALSEADKAIEESRAALDANLKVVLAGALLTKSKILSLEGQNDRAYAISAEAVALFRDASIDRPFFSFLLAHALSTHSHQLSDANRKVESYIAIHEVVELLQTLQISVPVATKRPMAWALFELARYRHKGADKHKLRNELQVAESAVSTFRSVSPLDYAGLADALYLYADRMLELDKNRDAATYAEESVQYFREAKAESPHKYALDLIFSLSLASSCLACTERSGDALEYAKQAVEVQHERRDDGDPQYNRHLRNLLMEVVFRYTEMDRKLDAAPWMDEWQRLGTPEDAGNAVGQLARRSGKPQPKNDTEFRKQTSYWIDASSPAPNLNNRSTSPASTHSPTPALQMDKGKGKEVSPLAGSSGSLPRVDKGKAREVVPPGTFSPISNASRLSLADEEILSPAAAAAAQRRRDELAGMQGSPSGSGNNDLLGGANGLSRSGNDDPLSSLFGTSGIGGTGGRTLGGTPSSSLPVGPGGRPLGSPIQQTARPPPASGRAAGNRASGMAGLESLLGGLGGLGGGKFDLGMFGPELFGPGRDKDKAETGNKGTSGTGAEAGGDETPTNGTWTGMGIQSKLSEDL